MDLAVMNELVEAYSYSKICGPFSWQNWSSKRFLSPIESARMDLSNAHLLFCLLSITPVLIRKSMCFFWYLVFLPSPHFPTPPPRPSSTREVQMEIPICYKPCLVAHRWEPNPSETTQSLLLGFVGI